MKTKKILIALLSMTMIVTFIPETTFAASAPAKPSHVYSSATKNAVKVTWSKVKKASYYVVRYKTSNAKKWKTTKTKSSSKTIKTSTKKVFNIQVKTVRRGKSSSWSPTVKASIADKVSIAGPSNATSGESVTFTASLSSRYLNSEFSWYINNTNISNTGNKFSYKFDNAGTYTVKAKAKNGMSASTTITVAKKNVEIPKVTPTLTINGKSVGIGESLSTMLSEFGNPDTIEESGEDYQWYIYNCNSNIRKLTFIGVKDSSVVAFYTCGDGWGYKDASLTAIEGENWDSLNSAVMADREVYATPYYDRFHNGEVYAIKVEKVNSSDYLGTYDKAIANGKYAYPLTLSQEKQAKMIDSFDNCFLYILNSVRQRQTGIDGIQRPIIKQSKILKEAADFQTSYLASQTQRVADLHASIDKDGNTVYHVTRVYDAFCSNTGLSDPTREYYDKNTECVGEVDLMDVTGDFNDYYDEIGSDSIGHRIAMLSPDYSLIGSSFSFGLNEHNLYAFNVHEYSNNLGKMY